MAIDGDFEFQLLEVALTGDEADSIDFPVIEIAATGGQVEVPEWDILPVFAGYGGGTLLTEFHSPTVEAAGDVSGYGWGDFTFPSIEVAAYSGNYLVASMPAAEISAGASQVQLGDIDCEFGKFAVAVNCLAGVIGDVESTMLSLVSLVHAVVGIIGDGDNSFTLATIAATGYTDVSGDTDVESSIFVFTADGVFPDLYTDSVLGISRTKNIEGAGKIYFSTFSIGG